MARECVVLGSSSLNTPATANIHGWWDALQPEERTDNFQKPHNRPKKTNKVCHA